MPETREEHIHYTRNELENVKYYIDIIKKLNDEKIESYIDIGANVGEYCNVLFEKISTLKKAYLIEPEPENFNFLKSNVKNKDVNFYEVAIGYNFSSGILVNHPSMNVGGFMLKEAEKNNNSFSPKIVTLEELNLPIVDLVKIDIEGGEFNLVENSKYLKQIKFLEIELHLENSEAKKEETIQYFKKYFPQHLIEVFEEPLFGRLLLKK